MALAKNNPGIGLAGALALSVALHVALIYGIAGGQRNVAESTGKAEKKSVIIDVSLIRDSELGPLSPSPLGGQAVTCGGFMPPSQCLESSSEGGVRGLSVLIPAAINYGTLNKVSILENSAVDAILPTSVPSTGQALVASPPVISRPLREKGDQAYPSVSAGGKNTAEVMVAATTSDLSAAAAPVTAVMTFAKALTPVRPSYPATAREGNITGRVTAKLLIDETGVVVDSTVVNAEPAGHFEASALAALRSTRFSPATRNGVAVKSEQQMVLTYRLE